MTPAFYILSLKWTCDGQHFATWWGWKDCGYTQQLDLAGRYSEAEVMANPNYYDNGLSTVAVPCDEVDAVAVRAVVADLGRFTGPAKLRRSDRHVEAEARGRKGI